MGKKGTKRKTKWRALPLGEEVGSCGNEEEAHDEDQSTTSSVAGQPASNFKRPTTYYRTMEKPYKQTKRFSYDRFRNKEPLVKLESKTFDEEEYTKITTPRQDVLFKKGYFGRKRESSAEENSQLAGEADEEEPLMDQIIITNGFVDERGHYLVNGNSYEIYDPYSNTVTVVVGPPPYANGVTQPVLAAVSCQPVPLHPVDWYPSASEWPSQNSWPLSYPRDSTGDSLPSPPRSTCDPYAPPPDTPYPPAPFFLPPLVYADASAYNGTPLSPSNIAVTNETPSGNDEKAEDNSKKLGEKSEVFENGEETKKTDLVTKPSENEKGAVVFAKSAEPILKETLTEFAKVEKKSHSTQTCLEETTEKEIRRIEVDIPVKESHSTQTPPEESFPGDDMDCKAHEQGEKNQSNTNVPDISLSPLPKFGDGRENRRRQQNRFGDYQKFQIESARKISVQRTTFNDHRKAKKESTEKTNESPVKTSYAKKAMTGVDFASGRSAKAVNGINLTIKTLPSDARSEEVVSVNGINRTNGRKRLLGETSGFLRGKKNAYGSENIGYAKSQICGKELEAKSTNGHSFGFEWKSKKVDSENYEASSEESFFKKTTCEDFVEKSRSSSEKSSTVSELSSPTELSSGQNTPPEKLIVKKMEEKIANEINKNFEEVLKQNLTKEEAGSEVNKEEDEEEAEERREEIEGERANCPGKSKIEKKRKEKTCERRKEGKSKKKKKKTKAALTAPEESKDKSESDSNSYEDLSLLSNIFRAEPQDLLFGAWEEMKNGQKDFISEVGSVLGDDEEILKSLGINEAKVSFSKLPLHSDLLMMLPTFGWNRPKLKIENFFAPLHFHSDLFTKRNIASMKSTKPEEFFASVVDEPPFDKSEKKKETSKAERKEETKMSSDGRKKPTNSFSPRAVSPSFSNKAASYGRTEQKRNRGTGKVEFQKEEKATLPEGTSSNSKLGIVEAVNSWLNEQGNAESVLSLDSVPQKSLTCLVEKKAEETTSRNDDEFPGKKNGKSNPIRASYSSAEAEDGTNVDGNNERMRVANVINDGFKHLDEEFSWRKKNQKNSRVYRSSSWDTMLSEGKIKKHFKFLSDSASFCQDLISDVRNGLPTKHEYATEELCDPRQSVSKYYTLAPEARPLNPKSQGDSDSENEVFEALEYKFLTKDNVAKRDAARSGTGTVFFTDSGVHSDMESTEDPPSERLKDSACKLQ